MTPPTSKLPAYHEDLTACGTPGCNLHHLTGEELFRVDPDDERAFWFAHGKDRL